MAQAYEWLGMNKTMAKWYDDEIRKMAKDNPAGLADRVKKWGFKKASCDGVWVVYQGDFLRQLMSHHPSLKGTVTDEETVNDFLDAVATVVIQEK